MADESIFTLQDAWLLANHRAVDVFSIYPGKHGGIAATADIVAIARAAGLRCTIGSNLELGVGTAAMLHVAAAFPEVDVDGPRLGLDNGHQCPAMCRPISVRSASLPFAS